MANDLLTRLATLLHRRRYEIIPRTGKTTTWQHRPLEIRQQILYYTIKKIPHDILFTDYSRNVIKHPTAARILLLAFTKAELSYPIRTFRAEVLPINGVIALERNHLLQDPRCTVKYIRMPLPFGLLKREKRTMAFEWAREMHRQLDRATAFMEELGCSLGLIEV